MADPTLDDLFPSSPTPPSEGGITGWFGGPEKEPAADPYTRVGSTADVAAAEAELAKRRADVEHYTGRKEIADPSDHPISDEYIRLAKKRQAETEQRLEQMRQRAPVADPSALGEAARGFARGTATGIEALGGAAEFFGGYAPAPLREATDYLTSGITSFGRDMRRDTAAPETAGFTSLDPSRDGLAGRTGRWAAGSMGEGIASSMPTLAAAIFGGLPMGAAISTAQGQGQMFNALREAFKLEGVDVDHAKLAPYVYGYGTAIGLLDSVTELSILSPVKKAAVVASIPKLIAKRVVAGMGIESSTELIQEALEIAGVRHAVDGSPSIGSGDTNRLIDAAASGAIPGGGFGLARGAREVPGMVALRAKLRDLGYTDEQIGKMSEQDVQAALIPKPQPDAAPSASQTLDALFPASPTASPTEAPVARAPEVGPVVETPPAVTPEAPARSVDDLGYYSAALEAAKEWKQPRGTPQQAIKYLKSKGVKDAEIEATGLEEFLADKKSVTREELASFLEQNRTRLLEATYARDPASWDRVAMENYGVPFAELRPFARDTLMRIADRGEGAPKWSAHSLDSANPTYVERVVHIDDENLPLPREIARKREEQKTATPERRAELEAEIDALDTRNYGYRDNHFPDQPNPVGHTQETFQLNDKGEKVLAVNQIQSGWGQDKRDSVHNAYAERMFDGKSWKGLTQEQKAQVSAQIAKDGPTAFAGAQDNAKIADLTKRFSEAEQDVNKAIKDSGVSPRDLGADSSKWPAAIREAANRMDLIGAELRNAESAVDTPDHPLIRNTDQWTTTILRGVIKRAVDSGAQSIAIPSGDTVLSYNPGDEHGMQEFYDKIVPKNLMNLLRKMDPSVKPTKTATLKSHDGNKDLGKGFTVFPITDKVREAVRGGQPMFAKGMGSTVYDRVVSGKNYNVHPVVANKVLKTAQSMDHMRPAGVTYYQVMKVDPGAIPEEYSATLKDTSGNEIAFSGPLTEIRDTRAIYVALDGRPAIISFRFDLAGDRNHGIRGEVSHESVHALWNSLPADVRTALLDHGDSLGILSTGLKKAFTNSQYMREAENVNDNITLFEIYHNAYQGDSMYRDMMDQEVAAHMMQWYVTGALTPEQVAPVQHILDGMLNGDFARGDMQPQNLPGVHVGKIGVEDRPMSAITAFHGSPHDFDQFSMDKIGTGEGAQAYGHGLYFAESDEVAQTYRDTLGNYDNRVIWKGSQPPTEIQKSIINQLSGVDSRTGKASTLDSVRTDLIRTRNRIRMSEGMPGSDPEQSARETSRLTEQINAINGMRDLVELKPPTGTLYEVSIDAEPEQFLDWDKPLSEQSEHVRKALNAVVKKHGERWRIGALDPESGEAVWRDLEAFARREKRADAPSAPAVSGSLRQNLTAQLQALDALRSPDPVGMSARSVLNEAGIVGIRYLDGGSRGTGEGTSNYVVFDDKLIKITKKDGKPVVGKERTDLINGARKDGTDSGPMFALSGVNRRPTDLNKLRAEGFNVDEPVFNGWWGKTSDDVSPDDAHSVPAYWFTPSREEAEIYQDVARRQPDADKAGSPIMHTAYVRPGKQFVVNNDPSDRVSQWKRDKNGHLQFNKKLFDGFLTAAKKAGYDSVRFEDVVDMSPVPHDQIVVFNKADVHLAETARQPKSEGPMFALSGDGGQRPQSGISQRIAEIDAEIDRLSKGLRGMRTNGIEALQAERKALIESAKDDAAAGGPSQDAPVNGTGSGQGTGQGVTPPPADPPSSQFGSEPPYEPPGKVPPQGPRFNRDRATPWQNIVRKITEYLQNNQVRVRDLVEQAEKQQGGGTIADKNDPHLKMTNFHGRVGDLIEKGRDAAQEIISDSKKLADTHKTTLEAVRNLVNQYLIAQHAPERNAKHGDGAAGMTDAEAAQTMQSMGALLPDIKAIAAKALALNRQQLDLLFEGGVINDFTWSTLNQTYKNHVPLNRIMNDTKDIAQALGGQSLDVHETGLRRAKGSDREVADVLGNIILNYEHAVLRAEKNIVDNATANFVDEYKAEMSNIAQVVAPKIESIRPDGAPVFAEPNNKTLEFFRDGTRSWIEFKDENTAQAFKATNMEPVPSGMKAIAEFTRLYASMLTRFNIEFPLPNKIRDMQEVLVYVAAQDKLGAKGALKTLTGDVKSTRTLLWDYYVWGKENEATRQYEEMKRLGGTTGGMGLSNRQQVGIKLQKLEKLAQSKGRRGLKASIEFIDAVNTIFEDSSRLSVYKAALAAGLSKERAAAHAKESSINFNRFGTGGKVINGAYVFANASIQGTAKLLRVMARNPKVAGAVIASMGLAVAWASSSNDEIDKDWRKKVTKWDRLNGLNFVIPTIGKAPEGKGGYFIKHNEGIRYISLPVSWGLKPLLVMGNAAFDAAKGVLTGKTEDIAMDVISAAFQAVNFLGGTTPAQILTPTFADPIVDVYTNTKWSGARIRPEGFPNTPDDVKYFKNLSDTWGGRLAISATRGMQETWPHFEVSPANLHYVAETLGGGPGRTIGKIITTAVGTVKGEDVKASEYPIWSRFYRSRDAEEVGIEALRGPGEAVKRDAEDATRRKFHATERAEAEFKELKKLDPAEAKGRYEKMKKDDRKLAGDISRITDKDKKEHTSVEAKIHGLPVDDGTRARHVVEHVLKDMSAAERKAKVADLLKRKVITPRDRMMIEKITKGEPIPMKPPAVKPIDFDAAKKRDDAKKKGAARAPTLDDLFPATTRPAPSSPTLDDLFPVR